MHYGVAFHAHLLWAESCAPLRTFADGRLPLREIFVATTGNNNTGTGGNQDGLKLSGVNDYIVMDCDFTRMSTGGSGIDHVGCHHGLIARCTFTEMGSNAIQC